MHYIRGPPPTAAAALEPSPAATGHAYKVLYSIKNTVKIENSSFQQPTWWMGEEVLFCCFHFLEI